MTKAFIRDGDQGRAADLWQKKDVVLDVFSCGTVVTTWQETEERVEDRDGDGRVIGVSLPASVISIHSHKIDDCYLHFSITLSAISTSMRLFSVTELNTVSFSTIRLATEFLFDLLPFYHFYCLLQLWAEWVTPGDSLSNAPTDVELHSPFFNTVMSGGWFKPSKYTINTLPGVDGAFAIMLSHLCCTEYSVHAIKKDLDVSNQQVCFFLQVVMVVFFFVQPGTPAHPPSSWAWGAGAMNLQFGGARTNGELVLRW